MPISFKRTGNIRYQAPNQRQRVEAWLRTTQQVTSVLDDSRGAVYRAIAAGSGFMSRLRGVSKLYVISWLYEARAIGGSYDDKRYAIDVKCDGRYYAVLFRDVGRDYKATTIRRIAEPHEPEVDGTHYPPPLGPNPSLLRVAADPGVVRTESLGSAGYGLAPHLSGGPAQPPDDDDHTYAHSPH